MTSTQTADTAVRYFIAVKSAPNSDTAIQGVGYTADEAIADAMKATGLENADAFKALEGTERFYRAVLAGGVARWTTNAAGLQDLDVDADDLAEDAEADAREEDEDEEVLPRVEDDAGNVLDGDKILPASFGFFAADGTEYAYRYTGPDEYEVRRWMPDEGMWWVERSEMIGDEVTVDTFLAIQQAA